MRRKRGTEYTSGNTWLPAARTCPPQTEAKSQTSGLILQRLDQNISYNKTPQRMKSDQLFPTHPNWSEFTVRLEQKLCVRRGRCSSLSATSQANTSEDVYFPRLMYPRPHSPPGILFSTKHQSTLASNTNRSWNVLTGAAELWAGEGVFRKIQTLQKEKNED